MLMLIIVIMNMVSTMKMVVMITIAVMVVAYNSVYVMSCPLCLTYNDGIVVADGNNQEISL